MQKDRDAGRPAFEAGGLRQRVGEVFFDADTVAGQHRGGPREIGQREVAGAVFFQRHREAGDRPGHAHGQARIPRQPWHGLAFGIEETIGLHRCGRGLTVVDRRSFVCLCKMHQHEAAAAEIASAGQGDGQGKAGGNCRVDRVAALLQNVEADAGGCPFLRHHHAMRGNDRQRTSALADDGRQILRVSR